jgi:diguanylate cyclase (GGDEF)-like protein
MRDSLKFKATLLTLTITVLVVMAASLEIFLDYRYVEERSYSTVTEITRVVERHTRDTVTYVDHTLDAAGNLYQVSMSVGGIRQPQVWKVLKAYCSSLIGCNTIWIVAPNGEVITQTRDIDAGHVNMSGQASFQRTVITHKLYIDTAQVSTLPGAPIVFNVSKPVYDAAGNLLAVVVASMETGQLASFYSLFGFSVEPTVAVYKSDGGLVARNPGMTKYVGQSNAKSKVFTTLLKQAPFGTFESHSPIDGKKRLAAYLSLPDLDLVIFSGIETHEAFAPWRAHTARRLVIVAGVLILIWSTLLGAYRAIAEKARLHEENDYLDDLAFKDSLTGVGNRRLFERTLEREWSKHLRNSSPLSVVLVDVDSFKQFNDHYGHPAGDECLRKLAQAIQNSLSRDDDFVARYGGEEFVAVLGCDLEGALLIAEKMRHQVENLRIPHEYSEASPFVTASFGVASAQNASLRSVEDLLASADTALYAAKSSGRNRVCTQKNAVQGALEFPIT